METAHARVTPGKLDVVDGEMVMILELTGEVVRLERWRELAHEHQDRCLRYPYSSWINVERRSK